MVRRHVQGPPSGVVARGLVSQDTGTSQCRRGSAPCVDDDLWNAARRVFAVRIFRFARFTHLRRGSFRPGKAAETQKRLSTPPRRSSRKFTEIPGSPLGELPPRLGELPQRAPGDSESEERKSPPHRALGDSGSEEQKSGHPASVEEGLEEKEAPGEQKDSPEQRTFASEPPSAKNGGQRNEGEGKGSFLAAPRAAWNDLFPAILIPLGIVLITVVILFAASNAEDFDDDECLVNTGNSTSYMMLSALVIACDCVKEQDLSDAFLNVISVPLHAFAHYVAIPLSKTQHLLGCVSCSL